MSGSNDLMQAEWRLTDFVHGFDASHAPEEALAVVRNMLLTTLGTAIAGGGSRWHCVIKVRAGTGCLDTRRVSWYRYCRYRSAARCR
ncbi:2-methylcitrate dehydratase PrpD [Paraburkholderia sp. WC7.3g]